MTSRGNSDTVLNNFRVYGAGFQLKNFKKVIAFIFLLTFAATINALPAMEIDYYGVVSTSEDSNMLKMAQDIFFTQLKSFDNATIGDKRSDSNFTLKNQPVITSNSHIAFFAELKEKQNETDSSLPPQWECTYNVILKDSITKITKTHIYESYYNILVSSKSNIEELLSSVSNGQSSQLSQQNSKESPSSQTLNLDTLAGNWAGEQSADKIVILRGGRGFVIFKNGVSMNIAVTVNKTDSTGNISSITVKQTGKPNASFYPALPREVALAKAKDANPITWELEILSPKMMKGKKNTLIYSASKGTASEGTEEITWYKK